MNDIEQPIHSKANYAEQLNCLAFAHSLADPGRFRSEPS